MTQPRNLDAEVRTFLLGHGPATVSEIALGTRARRAAVQARLIRGGFYRAQCPEGGNHRSAYWVASQDVPRAESGTSASVSQSARILAVLRDGRAHTTAEIHAAAGFSRLNSRVAEMRARGYVIECEHVAGVPAGPHAQTYRLIATPDAVLGDAA